ncbi:MAG: hypothetical protein MH321_08835 [Leptospiraceae bacterium]|nr:hypothetical protein [Leptospiraceae bacterium]
MPISISDDDYEIKKLADFRRGYHFFLSQFTSLATGLQNFFASNGINDAVKRELLPYRKQLDSDIVSTIKVAKDLMIELDEKHLQPAARKDSISYFQNGNIDNHQIDFIIFHKSFESLREFYNLAKQSWNSIRLTILSADIKDESFKADVILEYRIIPIFDKIDSLKILLQRMAVILNIQEKQKLFTTRTTTPRYSETKIYKLSTAFSSDFAHEEDNLVPSFLPDENQEDYSKPSAAKPKAVVIEKKAYDNILNTAGKLPWNSNQHYYFRFEIADYEEEKALFKSVISMDTHMGADEKALRSEMIRNLASKSKKEKSSIEIETEYNMFILRYFHFCKEILILSIGIPEVLKNLFFYHIGPQHFYMIARKFLQEANTGYIHVRLADGKKVSRVLPNEIIKKLIVDFWKDDILPMIGEERNNLAALKKIIEIVDNKYKEVSQHAMKEYDNLPLEIKNSKPRVQLFREMMNQWMGAANIIVFKRFLKTAG